MLPDNFYKFIGAIESTIHFISTQKKSGLAGITAEPDVYDPKNPYKKIFDQGVGNSSDPSDQKAKENGDLALLIEVKGDFLQAAAALGGSLAPQPSQGASGSKSLWSAQPPSPEEVEWAWEEFYAALDVTAERFLNAASRLIDQAPEWSFMDDNLQRLMKDFKNAVIIDGADIIVTLLPKDIEIIRNFVVETGNDPILSLAPEDDEYLKNIFKRAGNVPEATPLLQSSKFLSSLVLITGVGPDQPLLSQGIDTLRRIDVNSEDEVNTTKAYYISCRVLPATSWGGSSGSFSSSTSPPP